MNICYGRNQTGQPTELQNTDQTETELWDVPEEDGTTLSEYERVKVLPCR
jgi:hypothetical protein